MSSEFERKIRENYEEMIKPLESPFGNLIFRVTIHDIKTGDLIYQTDER